MNSEPLRISLVIPAYNEEKYIEACLEAAIREAGNKFLEIIVVNNASTDATQKIAESFPGVRVVYEEKKGLTSARQRGYLEAKGDILAYVDADTRMPPGWYEQIEHAFRTKKNLVCFSGPYTYYDISRLKQFDVRLWYLIAKCLYWCVGYLATGGNFAIRKSTLDAMGGFDQSISFYGEDTDIARRAHAFGRVLFSLRLVMPTSGRRFKEQGFLYTAMLYFQNFLTIVIRGKPATSEYTDIR